MTSSAAQLYTLNVKLKIFNVLITSLILILLTLLLAPYNATPKRQLKSHLNSVLGIRDVFLAQETDNSDSSSSNDTPAEEPPPQVEDSSGSQDSAQPETQPDTSDQDTDNDNGKSGQLPPEWDTPVSSNDNEPQEHGGGPPPEDSSISNNNNDNSNYNYDDSTAENTGGTSDDYSGGYGGGAPEDNAVTDCINSILSPSDTDKFTSGTFNETDYLRLYEKASLCFGSYSTIADTKEAAASSDLPDEMQQCIIKAVGLQSFNEVNRGQRQPLQDEIVKAHQCFGTDQIPEVSYVSDDIKLNSTTENCLILGLGKNRYNAVTIQGSQPTLEERDKIGRCFGENPNPLAEKPKYTVPKEVDDCVKKNVSEPRYQAIKSGAEPTEDEKSKAGSCFDKINDTQAKLMPVPPLQVPYLKVEPDKIKIENVTAATEQVKPNVKDKFTVLRGKALPRSLVDIYIFSDPIVVSTQADQNGDWVYKFNEPLKKGNHLAYATVKAANGKAVRSAVFNFQVAYAAGNEQSTRKQYLEEQKAAPVLSKFLQNSVIIIIGSIIVVTAVVIFIIVKKPSFNFAKSSSHLSDRKRKSKNSSRSVH